MIRSVLPGVLVVALAFALRLAFLREQEAVLGLDERRIPGSESQAQDRWAATIADGDLASRNVSLPLPRWKGEVAPESRWLEWAGDPRTLPGPPGLAYVLALAYALCGRGPLVAGGCVALLGSAGCGLVWWLGVRLRSSRAGLLAGLLLALAGPSVFHDGQLLSDVARVPFLLLAVLAAQAALERDRSTSWLALGASLALLGLWTAPGSWLLFLVVLLAFAGLRTSVRPALRRTVAIVAGAAIVFLPLVARNLSVGSPPLRLYGAAPEQLVAGWVKGASPSGADTPAAEVRRVLMEGNAKLGPTAWHTLLSHRGAPAGFLRLLLEKTALLVGPQEPPRGADYPAYRAHLATLRGAAVSASLLAPLALLGILVVARHPRRARGLAAGAAAAATLALIPPVDGPGRAVLFPFAALLAGAALDWLLSALGQRRLAPLLLAAAVLVPAGRWARPAAERSEMSAAQHLLVRLARSAPREDHAEHLREHLRAQPRLGALLDTWSDLLPPPDSGTDAASWLARGRAYLGLIPLARTREEALDLADQAEGSFARALELDEDLPGARHAQGRVAHELQVHPSQAASRQFGTALAFYLQELRRHPTHALSHWDAGLVFLTRGEKRQALQHFLEAERAGLEHAELLAGIAQLSCDRSVAFSEPLVVGTDTLPAYDAARALAFAERALLRAPENPLVLEVAATACIHARQSDRAIALLEQLAARVPARRAELLGKIAALRQAAAMPPAALRESFAPSAESLPIEGPPAPRTELPPAEQAEGEAETPGASDGEREAAGGVDGTPP